MSARVDEGEQTEGGGVLYIVVVTVDPARVNLDVLREESEERDMGEER